MDAATIGAMGVWLMISDVSGAHFNWPEIKKCAARAIPAPKPQADGGNSMLSLEWRTYEAEYQNITFCRNALAAHHEGWIAADPTKPDPLPPEPMMRDDDLR
jgi:hypothetical protein